MGIDNFSRQTSLSYHEHRPAGKIGVQVLKPLNDTTDLANAYSPGVAYVVEEIIKEPENIYRYTNKGNFVAVITNGTAVLGLGNTGPAASKPVMEGKAALIKALSGLDAIDIEIDCNDPEQLADIITRISHSFGGILLEDIKAPECFVVEKILRETLDIPVFHDDQHGTSIVVSAALINALRHQKRDTPNTCKVVIIGAGASAHAVFEMLPLVGMNPDNMFVYDSKGLLHTQRENVPEYKRKFCTQKENTPLKEALKGADIVIGLAGANLMDREDLLNLAPHPIILALSNPTPEADPSLVRQLRPDAILCTGRSDVSNQVNNIVAFPYLLKSLVVTRTRYPTNEIKWRMAQMIAQITRDSGPDELIPTSLDPRLKNITDMLIEYLRLLSEKDTHA